MDYNLLLSIYVTQIIKIIFPKSFAFHPPPPPTFHLYLLLYCNSPPTDSSLSSYTIYTHYLLYPKAFLESFQNLSLSLSSSVVIQYRNKPLNPRNLPTLLFFTISVKASNLQLLFLKGSTSSPFPPLNIPHQLSFLPHDHPPNPYLQRSPHLINLPTL